MPSRTDAIGRALSGVIGGPVGRHALIGRTRFLTPLRAMLLIALVFLAFGYTTKAACLQSTGTGTADQRVAVWENNRAYYEFCYSDTVPLYTAELLSLGRFPYKSSWIERDDTGTPRRQYDGSPAIRYMEYPVLTGIYQYTSMALAKTYTALTKLVSIPVVAEVVMFFSISALGLALAWMATVWATAGLAGRRIWDAAVVAASPVLIFHAFTNFDALATACAACAMLAWARRRPALAGALIGIGVALKLYPLLLFVPLLILGMRTGRLREVGKAALAALATWLAVNLPIMVLFPRGWAEFFILNTRRGDDMDSLYNVVKSFTGWAGFDPHLGFWEPPAVLNAVSGDVVRVVLRCNRLHRAHREAETAAGTAGLPGGRRVPADQQGMESAVLAVAGAVGRAGVAAPSNPVGVDDGRRAGVGATDVVPVRRAEDGPAGTVVHHDRVAARRRGDGIVRVGDPPDLPAGTRPGPSARPVGTRRRPIGRRIRGRARRSGAVGAAEPASATPRVHALDDRA